MNLEQFIDKNVIQRLNVPLILEIRLPNSYEPIPVDVMRELFFDIDLKDLNGITSVAEITEELFCTLKEKAAYVIKYKDWFLWGLFYEFKHTTNLMNNELIKAIYEEDKSKENT